MGGPAIDDLWWRAPEPAGPLIPEGFDFAGMMAERERTLRHFAGMSPPITRLIPCPRAIRLGGRTVVVIELRYRDRAMLQAWMEEEAGHPLEGLPPSWADPDPSTRPARLAEAFAKAESWPPRLGTPEGSRLLGTSPGRAWFLHLCLSRCSSSIDLAEVLEIADAATPAEWSHLERIAWGISPLEEIAAELAPDDSPRPAADWDGLFYACLERWHMTPDRVAELTGTQLRSLASEGKPPEKSPEHAELMAQARNALAEMGA